MFDFLKNKTKLKNKKINTENIRDYKEVIKTIKFFIITLQWEKAEKAISEISKKELESYKYILSRIDDSSDNYKINKERKNIKIKFLKKQKELDKLKKELSIKKEKYNKKIDKEKFKLRFQIIKSEIKTLSEIWKWSEALKLLSQFLNENSWKEIVIKFYNIEKKIILKHIEKEKEKQEKKLNQNSKLEALKLIWNTSNINIENNNKLSKKNSLPFILKIKEKLNFYKKIQKKIENKKLLDEITLLIDEQDKVRNDIATSKLENIHKWLVKEIIKDSMLWYEMYWKILWAEKISGDTFWFNEIKKKYTFFIGDATGHWIKAWFIITLLTRFFNKFVEHKSFKQLIYEINNWLKQDLKSMNFITWIFFEIFKEDIAKVNFIWLWHEPIFIYRNKTKTVEKIIPWWLAAWIRLIKNYEDIKLKSIEMEDWDILLTYSDWLIEAKSPDWQFYWLKRLEDAFKNIAISYKKENIKDIHNYLIENVKIFRAGANFNDDLTILLLKRNENKDEINNTKKFLEEIWEASKFSKKEINNIKWTTRNTIKEELKQLKKQKQIKSIIKQLEQLWLTWEILKLKQEAIRHIKDWFIDKKINFYLKKAIENQQEYKISLKEDRLQNKYNIIKALLKKWDYSTVIAESEEIISKDWNI